MDRVRTCTRDPASWAACALIWECNYTPEERRLGVEPIWDYKMQLKKVMLDWYGPDALAQGVNLPLPHQSTRR
jgi:hypothetical protein